MWRLSEVRLILLTGKIQYVDIVDNTSMHYSKKVSGLYGLVYQVIAISRYKRLAIVGKAD